MCGEFLLRRDHGHACLQCGTLLWEGLKIPQAGLEFPVQAGWPRALRGSRKVRTPKGRTLGKPQAAKADGKWHRKQTAGGEHSSRGVAGKGETVG